MQLYILKTVYGLKHILQFSLTLKETYKALVKISILIYLYIVRSVKSPEIITNTSQITDMFSLFIFKQKNVIFT